MALHLTSEDMARCETASRTLLSPLTASVDDWRRDVNRAMRELFHADKAIFMLPKGERLFLSEEAPDLAAGVESYVTAYSVEDFMLSDSVVDFWNRLRRQASLDVFTWAGNEQMIGRFGYDMYDSEMVSGVLREHRVSDFIGSFMPSTLGEVMVWLLFERRGAARFGEDSTALWRALLPSLKAGLEIVSRLDGQRHALDALSDAIAVFGADFQEMHRNRALVRLYEADPEGALIEAEVRRMALVLHPLGFATPAASGAGLQPGSRRVTTRTAAYDLVATCLPSGAFGGDPSVMIAVMKRAGAELPSADSLRERYGLTEREAEVALLLAEGRTNSEIAERLFVSPHTARRHTANIFDKLEVRTRKALGLKFLQGNEAVSAAL